MNATLILSFFNIEHKTHQIIAPPTLQWTYDISAKMVPQKGHVYKKVNNLNLSDYYLAQFLKKQKCSIIVSTKIMTEGHKKRLIFVNELQKKFNDQIDFYGFGFNPITIKKML